MHLNRTLHYFILFFCFLLTIPQPVESIEDWFTKGVAYLNAGRLDKAIEAFTRSIEMIPHDYEAYNNRGIAHSSKGESSLAENDFSKALRINPEFYNAYLNREIARQKQRLYSSSLWDYAQAHRLKPGNQRPQVLIAWILATCPDVRLQNGRLAIKIIKGLPKYRSNTKLLSLLAAAHAATNDFETAIALQKKIFLYYIKLGPMPTRLNCSNAIWYAINRVFHWKKQHCLLKIYLTMKQKILSPN